MNLTFALASWPSSTTLPVFVGSCDMLRCKMYKRETRNDHDASHVFFCNVFINFIKLPPHFSQRTCLIHFLSPESTGVVIVTLVPVIILFIDE